MLITKRTTKTRRIVNPTQVPPPAPAGTFSWRLDLEDAPWPSPPFPKVEKKSVKLSTMAV